MNVTIGYANDTVMTIFAKEKQTKVVVERSADSRMFPLFPCAVNE